MPSLTPSALPSLVPTPEPTPVPTPEPCRPGTYADVYWVREGLIDGSEAYASAFSADVARASPRGGGKARVEGGGFGAAPPRFNCTACPPGRFSNRSGVYYDSCLPCRNGTFSNDPDGATQCKPCQRGRFQVLDDSVSCDACPAGRFMNDTGEGVECNECGRGSSTNDETGRPLCTRCSAGNSVAKEGFSSVTECWEKMSCGAVGGLYFYQNKKGRASCLECENSGNKGAYGCNEKTGDFQCYGELCSFVFLN